MPPNLTNTGSYNLSNFAFTWVNSNGGTSADAVLTPGTPACSSNLVIGATCQFKVKVNDDESEVNKQYVFKIAGNYTLQTGQVKSLFRLKTLAFTSNPYAPLLQYTKPASLSVLGNNVDNKQQMVVVTNTGKAKAKFKLSSAFNKGSSNASVVSSAGSCDTLSQLASLATCNLTIKVGTATSATTVNSTARYQFDYYGGQIGEQHLNPQANQFISFLADQDYTITPNLQGLNATVATPAWGGAGNDGTAAKPLVAKGSDTATKTVVITYTNPAGANSLQIKGIADSNNPLAWSRTGGTYTAGSTTLTAGQACTVIYTNLFAANFAAVGAVGSSYAMPLSLPYMVLIDTTAGSQQFVQTPTLPDSSIIYYVNANQASITAVANVTGTVNKVVNLTLTPANSTGYPAAITAKVTIVDYFTSAAISLPAGCSSLVRSATPGDASDMTFTCSFTAGSSSAITLNFNVDPLYVGVGAPEYITVDTQQANSTLVSTTKYLETSEL